MKTRESSERRKRGVSNREFARALRRFDFEAFLTDKGVDVAGTRSGEVRGVCPLCGADKRNPFCVSESSGLWICHHCGESGGPVSLISRVMDVSYARAAEYIVDKFSYFDADDEDDDDDVQEVEVEAIELPPEFRPLAGVTSVTSQPYRRYARSRHLTDELIEKYNIGYCVSGRFAARLVIPVYHFGKVVSFVARAISDTREPKVDTPPGNEQGSYCFNLDNIWGRKEVLIVEGVFDALVLPEMAVCTFGKKISVDQVALLRTAGVESVIFCYDEDAVDEAYDFATTYVFQLKSKLIELPAGKDPSKLGREKMLRLLSTAKKIRPGMALHV